MNCKKCGAILEPNDTFCSICGTKVSEQTQNNSGGMQNENTGFSYEMPVNQQMNYNAQQTNNQPNGNQNYGQPTGNMGGNKNSNDITKIVVVGVVVLAIIGALILLFNTIFSSNKNDENKVEKDNPSAKSNVTNTNKEDDNSITNTNSGNDNNLTNTTIGNNTSNKSNTSKPTSTYTVKNGNFELYIPDNLIYQVDSTTNSVNIGNEEGTWMVEMEIGEGSYQNMKQRINELKSLFMQQYSIYDPTISDAKVETIDGVEYIVLEVTLQGETLIMAFTQLNSMYFAGIIVTSEDEDFDRNALKEISSVITTAKYVGDTSDIKTNDTINITDVNKIFAQAGLAD